MLLNCLLRARAATTALRLHPTDHVVSRRTSVGTLTATGALSTSAATSAAQPITWRRPIEAICRLEARTATAACECARAALTSALAANDKPLASRYARTMLLVAVRDAATSFGQEPTAALAKVVAGELRWLGASIDDDEARLHLASLHAIACAAAAAATAPSAASYSSEVVGAAIALMMRVLRLANVVDEKLS